MNKAEQYRAMYPKGTVIRLVKSIDDPVGARFRVSFVDDAGQLQGYWLPPESGSMAVIPGVDSFEVE